mmetsp:Transcript_26538/g.26788  ORF Transcript_26538/g.26788 Transcript_26538/m.26788 type:complete len:94 (-) Transcript_26538:358-639(-)
MSKLRDPECIVEFYRKTPENGKEEDNDFIAIVAISLATVSIISENKLLAWAGFFTSLSSLANMRSIGGNVRQLMTSLLSSVLAVGLRYFLVKG